MVCVRKLIWQLTSFSLVIFYVAGCTLGPDYERPDLDIPFDYEEPIQSGDSIANLKWWELFEDPQLQELIEVALSENKDLGIALSRIEEAYAALTITRSDQFPTIDASGAGGRGKQSEDINPNARTDYNFLASLDLFYEIDFWGKLRRATEAQRAELLATEASYRNIIISLVADVASLYFLLRDLDEQLLISKRTYKARLDSLAIIQARFDKGTVPELDVNQAEIEAYIAEVAIASFERQVVQAENALRVLLGRNPGPVKRGLKLDEQPIPPIVPTGLPSELLQRRPDLIEAEEQLHAQTARIGVAEALRYPSFTLTGSFGYESTDLSDLLDSDSESWNLFGNIFQPIFNAGELRARVDVEIARTEQAVLFYEQTFQRSLRDVEDALVAIRTYKNEYSARSRQVTSARNAARLSRARYDSGFVDYLEVLDTERTLFNAELSESDALQQYINSIVQLYKALGGGWEVI